MRALLIVSALAFSSSLVTAPLAAQPCPRPPTTPKECVYVVLSQEDPLPWVEAPFDAGSTATFATLNARRWGPCI
jgi:hypothetical protein